MNPKGENLRKCGLEGIKGSLAEPSEVGLNFDTWLRVLKSYFLGSKSQLQHKDSSLMLVLTSLAEYNLRDLGI